MKDYFKGRMSLHAWGILGGVIWGIGTIANFVASYVPMIGPATSFSLGEGNTMISAIWGIFVWKEFHGAGNRVKSFLAIMFLFFVLGLELHRARSGNPLSGHGRSRTGKRNDEVGQ